MEKRGIVVGHRSGQKQAMARTMRREMTPMEAVLWKHLRGNQCGGLHFRRQQIIDGFIADFYCHAIGLVVEVDGSIHTEQPDYDQVRDRIITARGLHVARFTNDRIDTDLIAVLAEIQALAAAINKIKSSPNDNIK